MSKIFPMSSTYNLFLVCFLLFVLPCIAKTSFRPKALVLPVIKHETHDLYITSIAQKNPLQPIKLFVDLGANTSWVDCQRYNRSTYKYPKCNSATCKLARSYECGNGCFTNDERQCLRNVCHNTPVNLVGTAYIGVVTEDVIMIQSTDGSKLGQVATVPRFLFSCVATWFTMNVPDGVEGLAAFGRSHVALPTQLAQVFNFPRKFSICLSPSRKSKGFIIFGDGPYVLLPNIDVSKNLIYTPLITNTFSFADNTYQKEPSSEYYIGVKSIKVNGEVVKFNTTLLSIDKEGHGTGGTKISTTTPYTVLETSIYNAVTEAFIKHLPNATRVPGRAPFGACFSSKSIGTTRLGPDVPPIDLVLQNKKVYWRIYGANSMVQVDKNVVCLGIVEETAWMPTASIIIGTQLIQDNLLQFDLAKSTLGFSSSLLLRQTKCANYNFTSHA